MKLEPNNMIEISGVSGIFPSFSKYFKQLHIQNVLALDSDKPDIKDLMRVSVTPIVNNSMLIKTPRIKSIEGKFLSGSKLVADGKLKIELEYMSTIVPNSTHKTNITIPFNNGVVLDEQIICDSEIKVDVFIEDIYVHQVSNRKFFISILLLLNVTN